MAGGRITGRQFSAYVDYQYLEEVKTLELYYTYCYVDTSDRPSIRFSALNLDDVEGEKFFLDIQGGQVDLTKATETPNLTRGWHRFSVLSKPITDLTSGIRQVLSLRDIEGDPVFASTKYFNEVRSHREPLRQVTVSKLKYGTRKDDHSTFALDTNGYVVVNFQPGSAEDLVTYRWNTLSSSLVQYDEQFELIYLLPSTRTPDGVRFKAVLRRDESADPAITPKLFAWAVRISR